MGYNGGVGCFHTKAEAEVHVEAFRHFVEKLRRDAAGGSSGRKKRSIQEVGGGEAKKQKVPPSLQSNLRTRSSARCAQRAAAGASGAGGESQQSPQPLPLQQSKPRQSVPRVLLPLPPAKRPRGRSQDAVAVSSASTRAGGASQDAGPQLS